ncbi:HTH-type transcriptional repressor CarH [Gammaproteobacteria bacterium]|nr:HTH-type transcriptional repressor CarH [Gammaproteobacteria bacterium]
MIELDDLREISNEPTYNAKAVTMQTGVTPATLRAWERRYGILLPDRTAGGHRLYSARDIAAIKWLKVHIEQGMTFSRASALLQTQLYAAEGQAAQLVPQPLIPVLTEEPQAARSMDAIKADLYEALVDFDELTADEILSEAYSLHPIELVCTDVIEPVLVKLGHAWAGGTLSISTEHFASNFLRRKLIALITDGPSTRHGTIAIGCAPTDLHEMGILLLSIFLRRRGWHVVYLGQAVPLEDLPVSMPDIKPNVLVLASTVIDSARLLKPIQAFLDQVPPDQRPIFAYGGPAFNDHPELRAEVPGVFLGETVQAGLTMIEQLMSERKK